MINLLTEATLPRFVDQLCQADADLQSIVDKFGYPPFFTREPGFRTLLLIILEQQVSLASAGAVYKKLVSHLGTEERLQTASLLSYSDATPGRVSRLVRSSSVELSPARHASRPEVW